MKKLIIILIIGTVLTSCVVREVNTSKPTDWIVRSVEINNSDETGGTCYYKLYPIREQYSSMKDYVWVTNYTGRFHVGDTLIFSKKQ